MWRSVARRRRDIFEEQSVHLNGHRSVWFNFRTSVRADPTRLANPWGLAWTIEHRCTECGEKVGTDALVDHVRRHVY